MLKVITKSGFELGKNECVLIDNEWYIKGNRKIRDSGEAYKIGTKNWHLAETCYFNTSKQRYCKLTASIKYGLTEPGGELDYFKVEKYTVPTDEDFYLLDYRIFPDYYYNGRDGIFSKNLRHYTQSYSEYNTSLYGADNNSQFNDARIRYDRESLNLAKVEELFDYTFGVEFETNGGSLHPSMIRDQYLIPVRDGSINGYEFITVPMSEELTTLKNQCYYLSRQCGVDRKTSSHIHIGNLPDTKEFAVTFYMLIYRFQNEINAMFPPFKKMLSALAPRDARDPKDYCKLLPELNLMYGKDYIKANGEVDTSVLEKAFIDIWTFWNDGTPPNDISNPTTRVHSKQGNNKWHYTARYSMINMNNYFFTDSRTIEFRYHEGTLNYGKISNWLLINIAFIQYAKNNSLEILKSNSKITFKDVLRELNNEELQEHLLNYICDRKTEMSSYYSRQDPYYEIFSKDKTTECVWEKLK